MWLWNWINQEYSIDRTHAETVLRYAEHAYFRLLFSFWLLVVSLRRLHGSFHLGSFRLLLRREKVNKVACNHLLSTEMKLQPHRMTENAWCCFAQDFAEGEARMELFTLRFKVW